MIPEKSEESGWFRITAAVSPHVRKVGPMRIGSETTALRNLSFLTLMVWAGRNLPITVHVPIPKNSGIGDIPYKYGSKNYEKLKRVIFSSYAKFAMPKKNSQGFFYKILGTASTAPPFSVTGVSAKVGCKTVVLFVILLARGRILNYMLPMHII